MATELLLALGVSLSILGVAGLLFPLLPGAPLLFVGLIVMAWAENFEHAGAGTISALAFLALLTYAVDIAAGVFGAKRFGASPRAMAGAGIGAILGLFFGLVGVVIGPFIGACVGEYLARADMVSAGRAGIGATVGLVLGAAVKIAIAFTMIGIFAVMRFG